MAGGKDLYDENKRMKAEIERLYERRANESVRRETEQEAMSALILSSVKAFLEGSAHLLIEECGDGTRRVYFRT